MCPARIVSLVPSTTESICQFGARTALVGCTRYCTEPASEVAGVARVGGTKNPDCEAILRLAPDLVLANREENRPEDLEFLAARVPLSAPTPRTVPEAVAALRELAAVLGADAKFAAWQRQFDDVLAAIQPPPGPPRRCYYAIWQKPWMTVSADTFVHDVLQRVGFANVAAAAAARYPEWSPAMAIKAGVELVLLASEPWPFDARQRDDIAAARTFGDATLLLCDGRDFCWHGTHLLTGLRRAAQLVTESVHQPLERWRRSRPGGDAAG
jgi:iron complex transport system substrate-binding protein